MYRLMSHIWVLSLEKITEYSIFWLSNEQHYYKESKAFIQDFVYDLFTHPSHPWIYCGLYLQSSEGTSSSVQHFRCLISLDRQKLSKGCFLSRFLLSITLWKYLFLSTGCIGNLEDYAHKLHSCLSMSC